MTRRTNSYICAIMGQLAAASVVVPKARLPGRGVGQLWPFYLRWQRHQDRVNIAAGFESEDRTPVVE